MKNLIISCCFAVTTLTLYASPFSIFSEEELKVMLVREFQPYPFYGNKVWENIPDTIRAPYLTQAEQYLNNKWESLPASYFMDFRKTGDRNRYQEVYFNKRMQLKSLAMAELLEGEGRFILPLIDGLFSVCEETWWGLPAHYDTNLPLTDNQEVDLFAAQTAGDMAMIQSVFRQVIDSIAPILNQRISEELKRRMLVPCRNRDFKWKTETNNWNPWITSLWISTTLLAEENISLRAKDISLALKAMDHYYKHYRNDGGCDEGPGYWGSACGSFFNCNKLLYEATNAKIDIRKEPKFNRMGEFICRIYMGHDDRFVNFADASPYTALNPGLLYAYGQFIDNEMMKSFGALKAREAIRKGKPVSAGKGESFHGFLYTMLSVHDIWRQPTVNPFVRDYFFPELQMFIARTCEHSDAGLSFAIKGGHNDESHNHNDIGNFIVFADGEQLLIDVGAMTYDAYYLTSKRYSYWAVNSDYHNTPVINGVIQKNGHLFAARNVEAHQKKNTSSFSVDLSRAYPSEAAVDFWIRMATLDRNEKKLQFTETYRLKAYKEPSTILLMTSSWVELHKPGCIILRLNNKKYKLTFSPDELEASVEKVINEDDLVQSRWGDIYRIKLRILSNSLKGMVSYSLTGLEE